MNTRFIVMVMTITFYAAGLSAMDDSPSCFRNLETNFFQENIVSQALSLYRVSQSQWYQINQELREKSKQVPSIVRNHARRMKRDPLDRPFQPKEASELLFQVLYGVFSEVMHEFDITREADIRAMFDYIRQLQEPKLQNCFGVEEVVPQNK